MDIGVTQWTLDRPGIDALQRAAALGFSVIQIDAGDWRGFPSLAQDSVRDAYLRAVRESGVEILAIMTNFTNNLSLTDPALSSQAFMGVYTAIDAAEDMNVPLVCVPCFNASEIQTEQELIRVGDGLRLAFLYAEERDVSLAIETTLGLEGHLQLLDHIDEANFQVLIDTFNPLLWGHSAANLITGLAANLSDQIHLKDGRDGTMGSCSLGRGSAQWEIEAAFAALAQIGYEGVMVSETNYDHQAEARAAQDIQFIQAHWEG